LIAVFSSWVIVSQGGLEGSKRRIVGGLVIFYGVYLSLLTGSSTALVVPGIGSIAIGAGTGAAVGFFTWLAIGTVGLATGGVGVAIGAGAMSMIGAIFGGAGGAAGGFGLKAVTYPLISPVFWIPLIVLGIYFLRGKKIKKLNGLPAPNKEDQ